MRLLAWYGLVGVGAEMELTALRALEMGVMAKAEMEPAAMARLGAVPQHGQSSLRPRPPRCCSCF